MWNLGIVGIDRRINCKEVRSLMIKIRTTVSFILPSKMSCLMVNECYFMVLRLTQGKTTLK